MNFIKANLYVLIAGLVALLAIGAYFWPLEAWKGDLQAQMTERMNKASEAKSLATTNIEIFPGGKKITGPIQDNVIAARGEAQKYMNEQASRIAGMASTQNQANRVTDVHGRLVPLLGGKPQPGYLPEFAPGIDSHDFKDSYLKVTASWPVILAGTDKVVAEAPSQNEVSAAYDAQIKAQLANAPIFHGNQPPSFANAAGMDSKKKQDFERDYVSNRASTIRMYVTADAFDREDWANGMAAPNEAQIFEALVRCWLQQDVVSTIDLLNRDAQGNPSRDVGQSAVKRLEGIKVGGEAGGALFQTGSAGAARSMTPGAPPEPSLTMTGRVSTDLYDVVAMTIVVDIEPAKINAFIDQLYRQNNAYTVLNVKQTTVDPFEAASNGYLYGETQCVRAEIQIEALLFRKWTAPIMPETIRTQLGLTAATAR